MQRNSQKMPLVFHWEGCSCWCGQWSSHLFIYVWSLWVFTASSWLSLVAALGLLTVVASLMQSPGFKVLGSVAEVLGLSCPSACEVLVPIPGIEPMSIGRQILNHQGSPEILGGRNLSEGHRSKSFMPDLNKCLPDQNLSLQQGWGIICRLTQVENGFMIGSRETE